MEGRVVYFPEYGEQNTDAVIECVVGRLARGDISTVVVATSTGRTALRFAERLASRPGLRLIAVANAPGSPYGQMQPELKQALVQRGVIVVDYAPYASAVYSNDGKPSVMGAPDLFVLVADIWRAVGGQGFKVAMEVPIMATNVGVLSPGERVIGVGGTATGADTAIVMKTAFSTDLFAQDGAKRPEMLELLCMPSVKKWW